MLISVNPRVIYWPFGSAADAKAECLTFSLTSMIRLERAEVEEIKPQLPVRVLTTHRAGTKTIK